MKKKILLTSIIGVIALGLGFGTSLSNEAIKTEAAEAVIDVPTGVDARGGAHVTYPVAGSNAGWTYTIISMMEQKTTGDMLYIRARNNVGIETPFTLEIASGNGGKYAIGTADLNYYLYDAFGCNEVERTYLYTTNIQLPAFFDGIVGIPLSNYTVDTWGIGQAPNWELVWRIYIALQPTYNSFANVVWGDVFNAGGLNLDVSVLNNENWSTFVVAENYSDGSINAVRAPLTDFDPTGKDLNGGIEINVPNADTYVTADVCDAAGAAPKQINGSFIWLRIRNFVGEAWIQIQIMGCDGCDNVPGNNKPFYYYDLSGNHVATHNSSAYQTIYLPADFNGFIGVPLASLDNRTTAPVRFDWLYGIFVSAWTGAHFVVGDVFGFNQSAAGSEYTAMLRDSSTMTWDKYTTLRSHGDLIATRIYPGFADDTASTFAAQFLEKDCTDYTDEDWAVFELLFLDLSDNMANYIATTDYSDKTDDELNIVEKAVQRYDLAVVRQNRSAFISGRTVLSNPNALSLYTEGNMNLIINIIVCISLVAAFGACVFFNRKRRNQQ